MDIIESVDALFTNLYQNILKSNGDTNIIQELIKDTQYNVLCYTTVAMSNDIQKIKPININKDCSVI